MRGSKKWNILAGYCTIRLGVRMAGCNKIFQSLVFVLIQQRFRQWSSESSILSPVAHQIGSRLATVHDIETGLYYHVKE